MNKIYTTRKHAEKVTTRGANIFDRNNFLLQDKYLFWRRVTFLPPAASSATMSLPTTDLETIRKIAEGDESVLNQIYQAHREEFVVWAQKSFRCSEDVAKDSYQVAFFIFYDNILTGKVTHLSSSIKTYLFGIGKHKLFEQNRKEARYCKEVKEELLGYDQPDNPYLEQEEKFQQLEIVLEQLGSPFL